MITKEELIKNNQITLDLYALYKINKKGSKKFIGFFDNLEKAEEEKFVRELKIRNKEATEYMLEKQDLKETIAICCPIKKGEQIVIGDKVSLEKGVLVKRINQKNFYEVEYVEGNLASVSIKKFHYVIEPVSYTIKCMIKEEQERIKKQIDKLIKKTKDLYFKKTLDS